VVRENSILILPAEPESQPAGDVIAEWFGSFHLPPEAARYLAEDKESSMTFDQLQPGDEVFLDANVFVYFYLGSSQQMSATARSMPSGRRARPYSHFRAGRSPPPAYDD